MDSSTKTILHALHFARMRNVIKERSGEGSFM